jgi:hypothetical protein
MENLLAAVIDIGKPLRGIGNLGLEGDTEGSTAPTVFESVISVTIGLLTVIAAIYFVILLITGAIGMMGAGADKASMESAKKRMGSGVIGLIVVVAAVFLARLLSAALGLDIFNPAAFLTP